MLPGAAEVLTGVKQIIFNLLVPELQSEQARGQAMYSALLIDHVIARLEIEVPLLLEERAELRALATQALTVIGDNGTLVLRIEEALEATASVSGGPRAIDTGNERMRSLVPAIARSLPGGGEPALELDAAIRAYIRNQHRRDREIVAVGEVAW